MFNENVTKALIGEKLRKPINHVMGSEDKNILTKYINGESIDHKDMPTSEPERSSAILLRSVTARLGDERVEKGFVKDLLTSDDGIVPEDKKVDFAYEYIPGFVNKKLNIENNKEIVQLCS